MTRILAILCGVWLAAVSATAQPIGVNPASLMPPAIVFPASAVNGAGVSTTGITVPAASCYGFVGVGNAVCVSSTSTLIKSSDAGGYLIVDNGVVGVNSGVLKLLNGGSGNTLISTTAPTVASAGTSPAVPFANGSLTFRINVGTGGTATTIVLAMPTAAAGWNCSGENLTANAANRADGRMAFQSSTTTAATLQYQTVSTGAAKAFTASDIVSVLCAAF